MDFIIFYVGMVAMTIIILRYASRGKNKLKNKDMFISDMTSRIHYSDGNTLNRHILNMRWYSERERGNSSQAPAPSPMEVPTEVPTLGTIPPTSNTKGQPVHCACGGEPHMRWVRQYFNVSCMACLVGVTEGTADKAVEHWNAINR